MITFLIFVTVLGVLVLVHELGHFVVAKKAGVRVDEFGFGYPPKVFTIGRRWGTDFTINLIPFGGFVKIFGENYEETGEAEAVLTSTASKKFYEVGKLWQVAILSAGVFFNIIFASILMSLGFMIGMPVPVDNGFGVVAENPKLTIVSVMKGSPAELAGLSSGDKIIYVENSKGKLVDLNPENASDKISSGEEVVNIGIDRGGKTSLVKVNPEFLSQNKDRKVIGVTLDMVGVAKLPVFQSIITGVKVTYEFLIAITMGLFGLVLSIFRGTADVSQVSGPVGIIGLVGSASRLGFVYLLSFTALISLNLAVLNLVPFPALDGGRILFVAIEAIKGSRIRPKVFQILNLAGFAILMTLMILVTFRDIKNLF